MADRKRQNGLEVIGLSSILEEEAVILYTNDASVCLSAAHFCMQGNRKLLKTQGLLHFRVEWRTALCLRKNVAKLQRENFGTAKFVSEEKRVLVVQAEPVVTV